MGLCGVEVVAKASFALLTLDHLRLGEHKQIDVLKGGHFMELVVYMPRILHS